MNETRILELRIHGIANSPPADMLSTSNEDIQRKEGDEQGSFWQVNPTSERTEHLTPSGNTPDDMKIVTEAYSWGNQARSGGSALVVIGRAIVHLGWLLVLPFGLCNLAYWARRDIKGTHEDQKWWAGGDGAALVRIFALLQTLFYTIGLVTVFVYLIGLQCFRQPGGDEEGEAIRACAGLPTWLDFLADMTPIARSALLGLFPIAVLLLIYLIGLRARGEFHPERSFNDERITLKEQKELKKELRLLDHAKANQPPRPPLMSKGSFWLRTRAAQISERTHLAAAFSFVLALLGADALMDVTGKEPLQILADLPGASAQVPFPFWFTVTGVLLLLGAIVMVYLTGLNGMATGDRIKRIIATILVWASAITYGGWCVWAIFLSGATPGAEEETARDLAGQIVVPTFIAAVGAIIAVASLTWGYHMGYKIVSWILLVIAAIAVVLSTFVFENNAEEEALRRGFGWAAVVAVILAVAWSYLPLRSREVRETTRWIGWHGNGAAVALLIAWFSSLVITSLLVLGAYAFLTRADGNSEVDGYWRSIDGEPPFPITPPVFYERFAGSLVAILIILILVVGAGAIAALRRYAAFSVPGLMYPRDLTGKVREHEAANDDYGGARKLVDPEQYWKGRRRPSRKERREAYKAVKPMAKTRGRGQQLFDTSAIPWNEYPTQEIKAYGRPRAVIDARRIAGLAHRGESLMRMLAILTAIALVPLAIPAIGEWLDTLILPTPPGVAPDPAADGPWTALGSASGWALGLLGLAAATWVVTNAVTSTERPLGLVWDIICFFPRAGHPFSPPCYAERAVPEIKKRIRRFLKEEHEQQNEPFVILSAHSMGATLAAATIFSLYDDEQALLKDAEERKSKGEPGTDEDRLPPIPRVALLTHGIQLRAYFSRFFPEVFGPRVLGIRGTRGPALFRLDPWKKQVIDEAKQNDATATVGEELDPLTLVSLLDGDFRPKHPRSIPRWRNLWRRTDYLGFPVFSHWSHVTDDEGNTNPIDRGATERSPRSYLWAVSRHNDYLSTAQYREARDELARMFRPAPEPEGQAEEGQPEPGPEPAVSRT